MMAIFQKDLVSENNHPLNLVEREASDEPSVVRPPILEVYMRMAEALAKHHKAAVHWYRNAAKQGLAITKRNLGEMNERCQGSLAGPYNGSRRIQLPPQTATILPLITAIVS